MRMCFLFLLLIKCFHSFASDIRIPILAFAHKSKEHEEHFSDFKEIILIANQMLKPNSIELYLVNDEVVFFTYKKLFEDLQIGTKDVDIENQCDSDMSKSYNESFKKIKIISNSKSESEADKLIWKFHYITLTKLIRYWAHKKILLNSDFKFQKPILTGLAPVKSTFRFYVDSSSELPDLKNFIEAITFISQNEYIDEMLEGAQLYLGCYLSETDFRKRLNNDKYVLNGENFYYKSGLFVLPENHGTDKYFLAVTLIHEIGHYYDMYHVYDTVSESEWNCKDYANFYNREKYFHDDDFLNAKIGDTVSYLVNDNFEIHSNCYDELSSDQQISHGNPYDNFMSYHQKESKLDEFFSEEQIEKLKIMFQFYEDLDKNTYDPLLIK